MPDEYETEYMCILPGKRSYTGAPLVQLMYCVLGSVRLFATPGTEAHQAPGKNTGVDCHFLLHVQLMGHL